MTESHLDAKRRAEGGSPSSRASELEQLFDDPSFDTDVLTAAELLGVGRTRLSQIAATGQLPFIKRKIGDRYRVFYRRSDLERRIADRYRHAFSLLPQHKRESLPDPRAGAAVQASHTPGHDPSLEIQSAKKPSLPTEPIKLQSPSPYSRPKRSLQPIAHQRQQLELSSQLACLSGFSQQTSQLLGTLQDAQQNLSGRLAQLEGSFRRLHQGQMGHDQAFLDLHSRLATVVSMTQVLERILVALREDQDKGLAEEKASRHARRITNDRMARRKNEKKRGRMVG